MKKRLIIWGPWGLKEKKVERGPFKACTISTGEIQEVKNIGGRYNKGQTLRTFENSVEREPREKPRFNGQWILLNLGLK